MNEISPPTIHAGVMRPGPAAAAGRNRGDRMRSRIALAIGGFALAYMVIIGRLVMFGILGAGPGGSGYDPNAAIATGRPNLVDRNGEILAPDIKMASLYAEPRNILDPDEATELITSVLPGLDAEQLRRRLSG